MWSLLIKPKGQEKWEEHFVETKSLDAAINKLKRKLKKPFELMGYQDLSPR